MISDSTNPSEQRPCASCGEMRYHTETCKFGNFLLPTIVRGEHRQANPVFDSERVPAGPNETRQLGCTAHEFKFREGCDACSSARPSGGEGEPPVELTRGATYSGNWQAVDSPEPVEGEIKCVHCQQDIYRLNVAPFTWRHRRDDKAPCNCFATPSQLTPAEKAEVEAIEARLRVAVYLDDDYYIGALDDIRSLIELLTRKG